MDRPIRVLVAKPGLDGHDVVRKLSHVLFVMQVWK